MKFLWLAALALPLLCSSAHAQERAAGSGMETQMTWTALSTQINAVSGKVDAVNSRVDQVVVCGKLGKIYAPGAPGATAQGCVEASSNSGTSLTSIVNTLTTLSNQYTTLNNTVTTLNNNMTSVVGCAKSGYFFNGSVCIAPATQIPSGTMCGASSFSTETGSPLVFQCGGRDPKGGCPSGYSTATAPIWGGKHGQSIAYCFKN